MSTSVFISYRRDDTAGFTRAMYNTLRDEFGKEHVFMDVDTLTPGVDFVEAVEDAVGGCQVLIAVIGPNWARGSDTKSRLDDPQDYVRLELEVALRRNILLVPVLVEDTVMPGTADLPTSIQALTRRNALMLSNTRFNDDMAKLVGVLRESVELTTTGSARKGRGRRSPALLAIAGVGLLVVGSGVWFWLRPLVSPGSVPSMDTAQTSNVVVAPRNAPGSMGSITQNTEVETIINSLKGEIGAQDRRLGIAQQQARSFRERALAQQRQVDQLRKAVLSLVQERDRSGAPAALNQAIARLRVGDTGPAESVFAAIESQSGPETDQERAAAAARHRGALAFLHDTDAALQAYQRAVELDPSHPEGWNELGHLLLRRGQLDQAEAAYQDLLALGEENQSRDWQAVAYGNLGNVAEVAGDLARAAEFYHRALDVALVIGDPESLAHGYINLGTVYRKRREFGQAEDMYSRALEIYLQHDTGEGVIGTYSSLGSVQLARGNLVEAEDMYRKALELAETERIPEAIANAYGNLGLVYQATGDLDLSEAMLRKSLEIETELGHVAGMAADKGNLATLHLLRGELDMAELLAQEALDLERSLGRRAGEAEAYSRLGLVYRLRGDSERDESMHRKALVIDEALDDRAGMARDYSNLGLVSRGRGQYVEARSMFERSLELYRDIGAEDQVSKVESWLNSLP